MRARTSGAVLGVAMSVLALGCAGSSGGGALRQQPSGAPGWTSLAEPAVAGSVFASASAFDGAELIVVGNRTLVSGRWTVDNGPRAFDPGTGTWRDLPPLPFDQPIVGPQLIRSSFGLVLSGTLCSTESEGFQGGDDDLVCDPGRPAVAFKAKGADAFESVALPRDVRSKRARAWLFGSASSSVAWVDVDGVLLQVDKDGLASARSMAASTVPQCAVGDLLIGTEVVGGASDRTNPVRRPTTLTPDRGWTPLDLGEGGGTVVARCGDASALVSIPDESPGIDRLVEVDERGTVTAVSEPPRRLSQPIWDGARFIAQALSGPAGGEVGASVVPLYALTPGGRWAVLRAEETGSVEALPLDGRVALYVTTSTEGKRTSEIVDVGT